MKATMEELVPCGSNFNSNAVSYQGEGHTFEMHHPTYMGWSLADLPEVVLVKIMEYLKLKERYYLSIMCQRLYELFNHPNLWKVIHINLLRLRSGKHSSRWQNQSVMPKTMSEIVKRFSHLFQHLSLHMSFIIQPFDELTVKLLEDLSHECRLESLSLEMGILESSDEDFLVIARQKYLSNTRDVHLLTGLLRNAKRLKHLKIVSWPLHADTVENNLFQALLSNDKLKSLESLSFFYIDKFQQWTGRVPKLPTPEQITEVVSFLPNLTRISLRSPMVNDEFIEMLASEKRKHLELLQVLIMWSRASLTQPGFKIPEIRDESWNNLKMVSQSLKVEFVIHARIPFDELGAILGPKVPLSFMTILKYGQCNDSLLESLTSKYGHCLTCFVSLCDSTNCDTALMNLVKECKNLNHLVYHGDINYQTIIQMATFLKHSEREMNVFEFKERNVKTDNISSQDSDDNDIVIRKNDETQEYFITGIQSWHYNEELHRKKLDLLVDHVRDTFGFSWSLCTDK